RCASSVCLKAGTSATIIAICRSTPASWTAYESSSVSPIFHLLNPPVTDRLADPAPRRAKREISSGARRRPAAWAAAGARAVHTLIESWNGSRRTGSARPWYLIRPWIGWATAVAFMSGPRMRLDVEDDLGDALLRVDAQPMASHRLDDELELVTLLVDRFPASP